MPEPKSLTGNLVSNPPRIDIARIALMAREASRMVGTLRERLLAPEAKKKPPAFSVAQLASLCSADKPVDKKNIAYRLSKKDLPQGHLEGNRRMFDLREVREWTREYRGAFMKPAGREAVTITVGFFKGGVTKTTTSVVLAQGLSMRGHKVLVIDMDPQGSATTLFGILPEAEVAGENTVLPVFQGETSDLHYAIQSTYWPGIDLIPAAPSLFGAEFELPAMQLRDSNAKFWNVLNAALDSVRDEYDVIVIDTPPALSYVTINAFWAANGIIVPIPPSPLDFASSAQFWSLFSDLGSSLDPHSARPKSFDFLHVLLSRVDQSDLVAPAVRQWIQGTYGEFVLPVEVPKTTVTSSKSAEFGTVYDVQKYEGSAKTYKRAVDAYDRFVELIEQSVVTTWRSQTGTDAVVVPLAPRRAA